MRTRTVSRSMVSATSMESVNLPSTRATSWPTIRARTTRPTRKTRNTRSDGSFGERSISTDGAEIVRTHSVDPYDSSSRPFVNPSLEAIEARVARVTNIPILDDLIPISRR